jgi:hypothetical protein
LDISRLHADWLISRQGSRPSHIVLHLFINKSLDFTQALAFDELRNLMQRGEAFVGFNEALINFPPTFKYDVLRTIKLPKKSSKWSPWKSSESVHDLSEIEEKEAQEREDGETAEECEEAASMASSVRNSKTNFEDDVQNPEPSPSHMVTSESAAEKPAVGVAVDKVKSRWMRLLSSPRRIHPFKQTHGIGVLLTTNFRTGTSISSADFTANRHSLLDKPYHPSVRPDPGESEAENEDEDRGVYDSSYKKRVPSWLNRIYQVRRPSLTFLLTGVIGYYGSQL